MCNRLNGEDNSVISSTKRIKDNNPYAIVSFVLGFLTGLYAILTGLDYYYAGWPAHGPGSNRRFPGDFRVADNSR